MSQHDVLNPLPGWDPKLGDSMNPSYGFTRKRAATRSLQKAVGGVPYTREMGNTGHAFTLSWLGRTLACVRRLKWFYEQFEDGYFTLIDHDGGGRHYVGRFTTEIAPIETENNKWDVQTVQFEEIPTVPMLQYPNDWQNDAVWLYPANDFGDQKLAAQGGWTAGTIQFGGLARGILTNAGAIGDWAQYEYRGYGFQLWMMAGPAQGTVQVLVDGVQVAAAIALTRATALEPAMIFQEASLPLDLHRVQVVQTVASPAGWFALKVMR